MQREIKEKEEKWSGAVYFDAVKGTLAFSRVLVMVAVACNGVLWIRGFLGILTCKRMPRQIKLGNLLFFFFVN